MNKLNEDVILYIFNFLVENDNKCIIDMPENARKPYLNMILLNNYFKNIIHKNCSVFFIYKPYTKTLPILCECNKHCNKIENKINIINKLNYLKFSNHTNNLLSELRFQNINECNMSLPYIRELVKVAYISEDKKSIYLLNKKHRYNSFV